MKLINPAVPILAVTILQACGTGAAMDVSPDGSDDRIQAFKDFLSEPHRIGKLVFSEESRPAPMGTHLELTPLGMSKPSYYFAKFSTPNDFFFRSLTGPSEDIDSSIVPQLLAASDGDKCWFHSSLYKSNNVLQIGQGETNQVCNSTYVNTYPLRQVLNLGIMHSEVGSVDWKGNDFKVLRPSQKLKIYGQLSAGANGNVDFLTVHYEDHTGDTVWIIRYDYGKIESGARVLPSDVHCSWVTSEKAVEMNAFHIHELELLSGPGQNQNFRDLIHTNIYRNVLNMDNSIYDVGTEGGLTLLAEIQKNQIRSRSYGTLSGVQLCGTYLAWASVNLWILAMVIKNRYKLKHTGNSNAEVA